MCTISQQSIPTISNRLLNSTQKVAWVIVVPVMTPQELLQETQLLLQRDRAMFRVIEYFTKSL